MMNPYLASSGIDATSKTQLLTIWLALILIMTAGVSLIERRSLQQELLNESTILHRVASQRADQHDAHLTALSAVASAASNARIDLFLDVANTIQRFYSRITSIELISLSDGTVVVPSTSKSTNSQLIVKAARESDGSLQIRLKPDQPGSYLLIKRSPNTENARYAIALTIDAAGLLQSDDSFWSLESVQLNLSMPNGTLLIGAPNLLAHSFSKVLGSSSQPFVLQTAITPTWGSLFPVRKILIGAVLTSLAYLLALRLRRQMARTRKAESLAHLGAHEARLAHASRVNGLGEMASGIAHELTQPLTAILSQVQAGKHMLQRGDTEALRKVLDDTIEQSKRASSILERMRRWTIPQGPSITVTSLQDAAGTIQSLLLPEAHRQKTSLIFDMPKNTLSVRADSVELEQVIFNLIRNALDAVANQPRRDVVVRLYSDSTNAFIEISDSGPGVDSTVRARIFEPFVSQKVGGTGLGLALCQRLTERMGGEISLLDTTAMTVFQVRLLLLGNSEREVAQ